MANNRRGRSVPMKDAVFLTKEELATRWKVCTKTIETWVRNGQCPRPTRLTPRRIRWKLTEIEKHEARLG